MERYPQERVESPIVEVTWRRIQMPDIPLVWEQLGVLDHDIIRSYMQLRHTLTNLQNRDITSPTNVQRNQIRNELMGLKTLINSLNGFLKSEFDRANTVLSG